MAQHYVALPSNILLALLGQVLELNEIASTDGLTGLQNRRSLDRRPLTEAPMILMVDIDHFKRVNDTYGHGAGDECLKRVGAVLQQCTRSVGHQDTAYRYGGEEFAVVLDGATMQEAMKVAERIRGAIAAMTISYQGHQVSVTASVGVGRDFVEADRALYQAKSEGRDRVVQLVGSVPLAA